ncbi:PAS domain-containing protein [Vibrio japonicus]|uniref:PAS domain-containing protein n=1 Tax=Vibrio japonicus TaxID=1824638 RepID=A0ABY5LNA2_9VIBR|nr:PAS domain-containing protein [Vibrio japonicus]UUM32906.1 PAS domain-containing protein [Vibrio japonicus]
MSSQSNQEVSFGHDEFIMSKTDTQGRIVYANRVFMRVSNYPESALLGQHHNIIRHPDMPKGVFHGLWKTLKSGEEFFGFVKNTTADGGYYWVFANVTPDYEDEKLVGYFSVRRNAPRKAREEIEKIYSDMNAMERSSSPDASWDAMVDKVKQLHGMSYEEFVIDLYNKHR